MLLRCRVIFLFVLLGAALGGCSPLVSPATVETPPALPTWTPLPPPVTEPALAVNPHVEMQVSKAGVVVGEQISVTARPVDLGLPLYYILFDGIQAGSILPGESFKPVELENPVLALESADASSQQGVFTFTALRPGAVQLSILISGEVHYGYPGPARWEAHSAPPVTILVEE